MMSAVGILADAPAVAEQPRLHNGVHLRWSSPRYAAFPWYGYFLYRRPSRERKPDGCLSGLLARLSLNGAGEALSISEGRLSSPTALNFTDDFAQAGIPEIDLRSRAFVRFDRPTGRPACRFHLRIGFREDRGNIRCVRFDGIAVATRLPLRVDDITITARRARGVRSLLVRSPEQAGAQSDAPALMLDGDVDIAVPHGSAWVEIEIEGTGRPFALAALGAEGKAADVQRFSGMAGKREVVRLTAAELAGLSLRPGDSGIFLHRVCYPVGARRERTIRLDGLAAAAGGGPDAMAMVATALATGKPGDVVEIALSADCMNAVRVAGGNAAILEICWTEVAQSATHGWEPVPKCPQPLSLPVRDPDYPAWIGSADFNSAEAEATGRVRYGSGGDWQGQPFADLYEQCAALVKGGMAAGNMNDPSRATAGIGASAPPQGVSAPSLQSLHPLDAVMLGSVHRPIAEMLGLSWTDETAEEGAVYDYLVATDRDGVAGGDAGKLLSHIASAGFTNGIDGWICFDQRIDQRPPLDPPRDVKVHALPGGSVRPGAPGDPIERIAGSVGLTWASQVLPFGWLQPGGFVLHHLWRGDAGRGQQPDVPVEADDWITKDRAVLSALANAAPTTPHGPPADWPPFPFNFVDFRLSEGWYAYQVGGVDIFGRFSTKSPFSPWWQWVPEPVPRPWYYSGTAIAQEIHPGAVLILDKRRPPVPMGLEAFVLDPGDPLVVQDAAYNAWRNAPGHAATIGLRVRWRWAREQQLGAPGVTEFRLYWTGGTTPPPGWNEPEAWPDRFSICLFNQNVTVATNGERRYEIFLPLGVGGAFAAGVPLAPSVADPIAYANVSVTSADDVVHTADRWPGGGRVGNESGCATPQKVFRVWRQKPAPPPPIVDGDRVYATPADWNGTSYHTFRWVPQPHLLTHVCRALDEAVFEVDWAGQPRPVIAMNDAAFPNAAAEPIWTNAKKTQVAGILNQIPGLLGVSPTAAQKAALKAQAFALYRAFSDDALRVLASRHSSDKAFIQVTTRPIDGAAAPDRRGPDDPPGYAPIAGRCAHVDAVDGRATNRLLYRAAFVDGAQNRSLLGLCSTPVRLPDVTPPRAPTIVKATGGDRSVTLAWASNREADLLEYRVYRAAAEADAADLRAMTQVAQVAANPDPAARPAIVQWTDAGVPGRRDLFYRVVAVDRPDPVDPRGRGGNQSAPSIMIRVRAFDDSVPVPPAIGVAEWIRIDDAGTVFPFGTPIPPGAVRLPAVRLSWAPAAADEKLLVQMRPESDSAFRNASAWLAPATVGFIHRTDLTFEPLIYRLKVVNGAGTANTAFAPIVLANP